ncbi:MAG: hypothetical protein WD042_00380 [Phycisphaeraceae bacterium]
MGVNLQIAANMIDVLRRATAANLGSTLRQGATVHLPAPGRVVMSGDLHDHRLNFQRLCILAALSKGLNRHLILHELCHGPHLVNGMDLSIRMVGLAAQLKLEYPQQVHFLQANHDLAQARGEDILKAGRSVVAAFNDGVAYMYGDDAPAVCAALAAFIKSLPLAVRLPNGILCTHSLPSPVQLPAFDPAVLERVPDEADLSPGGSGHMLIWGRNHTQALADQLAQTWGVRVFVMGHQPADMGHETQGQTMLILSSDGNHGVGLPIDLSRSYTRDELVDELHPLAGVPMRMD